MFGLLCDSPAKQITSLAKRGKVVGVIFSGLVVAWGLGTR
jgi:hypothetical protein